MAYFVRSISLSITFYRFGFCLNLKFKLSSTYFIPEINMIFQVCKFAVFTSISIYMAKFQKKVSKEIFIEKMISRKQFRRGRTDVSYKAFQKWYLQSRCYLKNIKKEYMYRELKLMYMYRELKLMQIYHVNVFYIMFFLGLL